MHSCAAGLPLGDGALDGTTLHLEAELSAIMDEFAELDPGGAVSASEAARGRAPPENAGQLVLVESVPAGGCPLYPSYTAQGLTTVHTQGAVWPL